MGSRKAAVASFPTPVLSARALARAHEVLAIPHILQNIVRLTVTDASDAEVRRLAFVNTDWFIASSDHIFPNVEFNPGSSLLRYSFPWPLRESNPLHSTPLVEDVRQAARNSIRTVDVFTHDHDICAGQWFEVISPPLDVLAVRLIMGRPNSDMIQTNCAMTKSLDPTKYVLMPLPTLGLDVALKPNFGPSTRKLVCFVLPPLHSPGPHAVYADLPTTVTEVVVHLWQGHPAGSHVLWAELQQRHPSHSSRPLRWPAFKVRPTSNMLANHFANLVVSSSKRRYTFVGCDQLDAQWVTGKVADPDAEADDVDTMRRFAELVHQNAVRKVRDKKLDEAVAEWDGRVRFLTSEEYIDEGDWRGEFTMEEYRRYGC